tara:strand:+ start:1558 stop:1971 length:414 start_codon:yes stop_codon:yes gene_type:complete
LGLKSDIKKVVLKSMGNPEDEGNVDGLAQGLSDAIINFLTKQTFTITDMKATIEIDGLRTTGPITTELPILSQGPPGAPIAAPGQPILSALNLGNTGGQGGVLQSVGYAYLGKASPQGDNNSDDTKVKLLTDNIVGE